MIRSGLETVAAVNKQPIDAQPIPPDFSYSRDNLWLKYLVDRVSAFVLLVVLSPVLAVIGLAIAIQSAAQWVQLRAQLVDKIEKCDEADAATIQSAMDDLRELATAPLKP